MKDLNKTTPKSYRARVLDMAPGESFEVSPNDCRPGTLRGYASEIGFFADRKYKVSINKATKMISVSRIS